jgi:hypothetical protein
MLTKLDPFTGLPVLVPDKTDIGLPSVPNVDCTNASNITFGVLPLAQHNPAALERLYKYTGAQLTPELMGLTTTDVQNGDTIQIYNIANANHLRMWIVNTDTALNVASSFTEYTAGTASAVAWGGITGVPSPVSSLSGTNTGDNAVNSNYSSLVSNATHTGDATGATALTVVAINNTNLASLATGILKNTTSTGVPSIAVAADFPMLNQNTTGNAATVTTNANLSGHVTSVGNTTSLGSFTLGQLDTAISDASLRQISRDGIDSVGLAKILDPITSKRIQACYIDNIAYIRLPTFAELATAYGSQILASGWSITITNYSNTEIPLQDGNASLIGYLSSGVTAIFTYIYLGDTTDYWDFTIPTSSNKQNYFTYPPTFKGVIETHYQITDTAGFAIDPNNGTVQYVTLGANRTPVAANWAIGQSVTLMVDDGTAYAITWSGLGVTWLSGLAAPTLATTGYTAITLFKGLGGVIYGSY